MATGTLMFADSMRDADLFLATGIAVGDPFAYIETDGRKVIVISALEADAASRNSRAGEVWLDDELGYRQLVREGGDPHVAGYEVMRRALERLGLERVTVPPSFPVAAADYLRGHGVAVVPDSAAFRLRRRLKDAGQLAGIERAQRATEAAFARARELLAAATPDREGILVLEGEPLTCERLADGIERTLREHGCEPEDPLVGAGAGAANVHERGSGPIRAGEGVIIDIFPRDRGSRMHADMTRTFCVGEAPERLRHMHATVLEALRAGTERIVPGVNGRAAWEAACDVIERDGYRTQRSAGDAPLDEDFFHGLGHGVGIEIHEAPNLGMSGDDLLAGDVVTVEPGVYRKGFGGVRLEDTVAVTEDGHRVLTDFPYDLEVR